MTPGAAGLRRARGRLGPCDPGRRCCAVGGVQKGNRRAAPCGSPRGAVWRQNAASGTLPRRAETRLRGSGSAAGSGPAPARGDARNLSRSGLYLPAILYFCKRWKS